MPFRRIHVVGASGSGTTTLGRALATALALPHFDADDFFWRPTEPPFREKRPGEERLRLMREMFLPRAGWALSGSAIDWVGLEDAFDLVVFLYAPAAVRLARLKSREAMLFGARAVAPKGSHHAETRAFLDWAAQYDEGPPEGRSRAMHEAQLAGLACPVLRLSSERSLEDLVASVRAASA